MVNMNLGKMARNTASITNNTNIYGDMGGTGRGIGRQQGNNNNYYNIQTRAGEGIQYPYLNPGPKTINYLRRNRLLSVNPASSGGVGRMFMPFV